MDTQTNHYKSDGRRYTCSVHTLKVSNMPHPDMTLVSDDPAWWWLIFCYVAGSRRAIELPIDTSQYS